MSALHLGDVVPNFVADTSQGKIDFYEWKEDKWVVLFSHPADFTPVCTTELGTMALHEPYFTKRNVKLLAHSVDDFKSHVEWMKDIMAYCRDIPGEFPYPIICDPSKEIAVKLNMIHPNHALDKHRKETVRALYIIDPKNILRLSLHYPNSTGRSVKEILRVIDSLQLTDQAPQLATPSDWNPGEEVMVYTELTNIGLNADISSYITTHSLPSGKNYMRTLDYPFVDSFNSIQEESIEEL